MKLKSAPETTSFVWAAAHSLYAFVSLPNDSPVFGFTGPSETRNSSSNLARPSKMSVWTARPVRNAAVSSGAISPVIFLR